MQDGKTGGSGTQGHLWPQSVFKTHLGYMRPCIKNKRKKQRSVEGCSVARDGQTSCVDLMLCFSHFINVCALEILSSLYPHPPSLYPFLSPSLSPFPLSVPSFLSAFSPSFFPPALPFPQCLLQFQVLCLHGTYRNIIGDHLTIFENHIKISSWAFIFCYLFGKSISGQSQNKTFTILHEPGFLPGEPVPLPDLGKAAASALTYPTAAFVLFQSLPFESL